VQWVRCVKRWQDRGRLAQRVGVAESTSIKRLRALREAGVVTGFTAQLNLAALGFPIQAVIKVRLSNHNRDHVLRFHATLTKISGVLTAFHVAGEDDYLLHVAVRTPQELRDLVLNHIVVHGGVQHTQTQLVFGVLPGPAPPSTPASAGQSRPDRNPAPDQPCLPRSILSGAIAYSAKPPLSMMLSPYTSSPGRNRATAGPTTSTRGCPTVDRRAGR
jgi:DNA-binding Lrp family transcriptional regulator